MTSTTLPRMRQPKLNPYLLALFVLVMAALGAFAVQRFSSVQQARETVQWQNKLNLIADSRADAVNAWLNHHFKELESVAGNPSLQLYLGVLASTPAPQAGAPAAEEPAQAVYLRDLLSITADRMGFTEKTSAELKSINADVPQPTGTGLAILGNDGKFLVSTSGLTSLDSALAAKVAAAPKNQTSLIDLFPAPNGKTRIGFIVPIYPIQGEAATNQQSGVLVAIKDIDDSFFHLLQHPGVTDSSLEAVLLRKADSNVVFLSPSTDKNISATFALDTPNLDAAYAVTTPQSFAAKADRLSHATLMTSRAIPHSPWVLMVHVDRAQALAESDRWRQQMEAAMLFALLAMIGGVIAVWYYGTSKRSLLLSIETGRLAARLAAQEKLLRVVADNQLEPILIVDAANIAHFANRRAADRFQLASGAVDGKSLAALMGAPLAETYAAANKNALESGEPVSRTWRSGTGDAAQIMRSQHIPLPHIPIDLLPNPSAGVLVIDQDISDAVHERERRLRAQQQLVNVLVYMVDKRDPHAAHHSAAVALLAREMAVEMSLGDELAATAETAGKLMNIGKIMVPSQILIKESALGEDERRLIRESLQASVALLERIDFDGPVVDTLRQMQERFDGAGPLGLKAEHILATARIIAAANAFVGMVSARSYRPAIDSDQAITLLMQVADIQFDRRAIIALANFVTNRRGKEAVAGILAGK